MKDSTRDNSLSFWKTALLASPWVLFSTPVLGSPVRHFVSNAANADSNAQIITGLFGTPSSQAQIVIHDTNGQSSWTWNADSGKNLSPQLRQCLHDVCQAGGCTVPENKWANNGQSVVAIYGYAAVVINHHPGLASDKAVTFGVCLNRDGMDNTHTVELLPDGKIAIATTGTSQTGSIKIFNLNGAQGPLAAPIQQLDGIPAAHSLLWDAQRSVLWAAGNDISAVAPGSRSILNAYTYRNGAFLPNPETHVISNAMHLTTEWGANTPWWDGSHSMTPIPHQRKLLITTDLDVHVYDMDRKTFEHGNAAVQKYLKGFQPVDARVGPDGVSLPRSDIKTVSILGNGNTLYVQAVWGQTYGTMVNLLVNGQRQQSIWNQMLYRSRWFTQIAW